MNKTLTLRLPLIIILLGLMLSACNTLSTDPIVGAAVESSVTLSVLA